MRIVVIGGTGLIGRVAPPLAGKSLIPHPR